MRILLFPFILFIILKANASKQDSLAQPKIQTPAYYHLQGKIDGKYAITMDISISSTRYGCNGSYYYDAIGRPIPFFSGTFQSDSIDIYPATEIPEEEFAGHFDGTVFSGTWYRQKRKSKEVLYYDSLAGLKKEKPPIGLPFVLTVDTSESIPLENLSYAS